MDKEKLILSRIVSGLLIFKYNEETLYLIYPSLELKYEAELYYEDLYESYKFSDWITESDIVNILKENRLWSDMNEKQFGILQKQIDQTKIELFKSFFNNKQQKTIRAKLNNFKNLYQKYYDTRHSLDHLTVDGFCEKYKNEFLLINSLYKKQNNEYIKYFDSNIDTKLLDSINYEISKHNIDISVFRKLARGDHWRTYWSANKNFLFKKPASEWTDEQRTLVVFSKMYDSAHESMEPPPDPVFDDDDMFDGWILLQNENAKQDKQKKTEEKALGAKMSKAQEVFIMANSSNDANNIYDMNNSVNKSIIAERNATIAKHKDIDASKLPDTKREIAMTAQQNFKDRLRKK